MKRIFLIAFALLAVILIVFFTGSTKHKKSAQNIISREPRHNEVVKESNGQSGETKTYTTHTGKSIILENTHPIGASLSTITIKPSGFEISTPIILTDIDPLENVLVADLDKNGFDEIYLISRSAGSGSYGKIYGFASNRDKSLSAINADNLNKNDRETDLFAGYRGREIYKIEGHFLTLEFPVYAKKDPNSQPSEGRKIIKYTLVAGEAGYRLEISR